jgi:thiol-disulfide isomerase/thioredoxin
VKTRTVVLLVVLVVMVGYQIYRGRQGTGGASPAGAVGRAAPQFALNDLAGQKVELAALRGKVVLLDFWATWCAPCREEIPHFVEMQEKYRGQGLEIVGVSVDDSVDPVRKFYQEYKMNYPVVMGDEKLAGAYGGILGLPIAFLIDRDGKIVKKHIGQTEAVVFEREVGELLGK